jgi:predicted RNA polymerase sigma factor
MRRWSPRVIRLVRERLAIGVAPGRYQILAAINAVHTSARDVRDTDWLQVVALCDQLVRLDLADHRPQPGRRDRRG